MMSAENRSDMLMSLGPHRDPDRIVLGELKLLDALSRDPSEEYTIAIHP